MSIIVTNATFSVLGDDGKYRELNGVREFNMPKPFSELNNARNNVIIALKGLSSVIGSIECSFSPRIYLTKSNKRGRFGLNRKKISKKTPFHVLMRGIKAYRVKQDE